MKNPIWRLLGVMCVLAVPFQSLLGQLSITTIANTTIDFTSTTTGIVEGPYDGSGFASTPSTGQLDSDGVATDGFSNLSGGSFTRAALSGYPSDAVYHIDDGGSADWVALSPGADSWSITFEVVNNSGFTIESIDVVVDLYLFNDNDGAQDYTFSFAYSSTGPFQQIGSTIPGVGTATPIAWGAAPFSQADICTGSIANGSSIFLRLSASGTGRDDVGINSISLTPSTTAPCTLSNTSGFSAVAASSSSVDVSWTDDGSGDCSETFLVVARAGTSPAADITETNLEGLYDETDFSANTDWSGRANANEVFASTGNTLGVSNEDYFVFEGTGTSATITGLDASTDYNFLLLVVGETCVWEVIDNQNAQTLLPIELISFEGEEQADGVYLKWITAFEEDNDFMAVERSTDKVRFEEIGSIAGSGSSLIPNTYEFMDESPNIGTNYYRLKQVDFDGTTTYHKMIAIDYKAEQRRIQLRSTMVSNELEVQMDNIQTIRSSLVLIDPMGRIIRSVSLEEGQKNINLNISDLNQGWYYLQFQGIDYVKTLPFMKQ